jgi:hypothetical protein
VVWRSRHVVRVATNSVRSRRFIACLYRASATKFKAMNLMKKFIEEHAQEVMLILITMIGITRWWIPNVKGFENIYTVSHWVLSYDVGFIRRGLVGTIMKLWVPIVTIEDVHHTALVAYCIFLLLLLIVFYRLMQKKENDGRLFFLIYLFVANPATIAMLARDLGRFDLFLTMIAFLSLTLIAINKHLWLVPILMATAMFIHESFIVAYAPTIAAAFIFTYYWNNRAKKILAAMAVALVLVAGAFSLLYAYGSPTMGYDELLCRIQSRAAFTITPLSMHECFFDIKDHYRLASSSLYDAGSIANFSMALFIVSPVILVLLNLWTHAFKSCGTHRNVCILLLLATISGFLIVPIATDYGRWLSAVIFCNFFAIFFLIHNGVIKTIELKEYSGGSFRLLFVTIIITYLLFGPLHDWNPYPYMDNLFVSSLSLILVLLFDVGFYRQWQSLRKEITTTE